MSCCSKPKKRWPMIVFLIVVLGVILIAAIADSKANQSQVINATMPQKECPEHSDMAPICNAKPPQSP